MKPGRVESYLHRKIEAEGSLHFTLIDPEKTPPSQAAETASRAEKAGSSAILLGGSTIASQTELEAVADAIKRQVKIPLILFPGNVTGLSGRADAILFMSLLNSSNPYFLVGAQAIAAPIVRRLKLEAIPLGYIIMGQGGAAGYIGFARPIPFDKPSLATAYALAGQYLGMRLIYLEAGSGAERAIPARVVEAVKKVLEVPLIVGGGIRNGETAGSLVKAGADIIVTGTVVEEAGGSEEKIRGIVKAVRQAARRRRQR
ncbi:MAG: geranylgeranylglyceryl/heptaprenylglyceryl phosphate synthase [Candidatus Hecatellales archaeon]|nr:MAG: geranylgeranylglyceryl/heptaprenylglyceryl phosphate synthase [Candidatus Hecatellales archaeon]